MMPLHIAITHTPYRFEAYLAWLRHFSPDIEFTTLAPEANLEASLAQASGLVLTGGADVDPALFGLADPCGVSRSINRPRDELEIKAVQLSLERGLPVLGICRGLQVVNVALGGTLILDLPSAGFSDHSNRNDYALAHTVSVLPGTQLADILNAPTLPVNTSHHQAIAQLGKGLVASAFSEDGVIEAAEWKDLDAHPYMSLVQWHPEAMLNAPDPRASERIGAHFIDAVSHKRASDNPGLNVL